MLRQPAGESNAIGWIWRMNLQVDPRFRDRTSEILKLGGRRSRISSA
jgi:hypothetical protein